MKEVILDKVRAAGITKAACSYSGSDGDGQIDEIGYEPTDNVSDHLNFMVHDLFWDVTQDVYEGFQDGDGLCGRIVWDVTNDIMTIFHAEREPVIVWQGVPADEDEEDEEIGA